MKVASSHVIAHGSKCEQCHVDSWRRMLDRETGIVRCGFAEVAGEAAG